MITCFRYCTFTSVKLVIWPPGGRVGEIPPCHGAIGGEVKGWECDVGGREVTMSCEVWERCI